ARPFRVPGGIAGACLLGVAPAGLLVFALVKNLNERIAGVNALAFAGCVVALGPLVYLATRPRGSRSSSS
ncbi:MAG TPA: hypothetical protein VKU41_04050, partial [Polyangiaceae bacterium]|nr:hypothetical protein [Polyangiaceae bacterium]